MKKYDQPEQLPVSAIKQYIYCKRRFALIFIDSEWESNYKIIEGNFLHEKVNDPFFSEKRKDLYRSRSVPVFSDTMNVYGVADMVEFARDDGGVKINSKNGLWRITPVEYKNGRPEKSGADNYQLCAIAMCLEEIFNVKITKGEIFYGKIKRRVEIPFTNELRLKIFDVLDDARKLLAAQVIPPKPTNQNCNLCSLGGVCMPKVFKKRRNNREDIISLLKKEHLS